MRSKSRSRTASTSARGAIVAAALLAVCAGPGHAGLPATPSVLALPESTPLELASRAARPIEGGGAGWESRFALQEAGEPTSPPAPAAEAAPPLAGKRKALLYSLLLPGAGELSLGARGRATGFFVAEGLIWSHYVWYQVAGKLRRDDYIEQAQLNAGIGSKHEDDEYWRLVGLYERSHGSGPGSYEEDIRREARDLNPDDPAAQDAYVAERLPTGDRVWIWSSPELQSAYRSTRASSNRAYNRAKYSFAAAILNRLVSAIDTQILHRRLQKNRQARLDEGTRLLADATPDGGARLLLLRRF